MKSTRKRLEKIVADLREVADEIMKDAEEAGRVEAFPRPVLRYELLHAANVVDRATGRLGRKAQIQNEGEVPRVKKGA